MREMTMYKVYNADHIGCGVVGQEFTSIVETPDGAEINFVITIRDSDKKVIANSETTIHRIGNFEDAVNLCKNAGWKVAEEVERMINFHDEWAIVYQMEDGSSFWIHDGRISRIYHNSDRAVNILYRAGFIF